MIATILVCCQFGVLIFWLNVLLLIGYVHFTRHYSDQMMEDDTGWLAAFCMNELKRCTQDCGGEPEGMRPLGRLRGRWIESIKMDLKGIGWGV